STTASFDCCSDSRARTPTGSRPSGGSASCPWSAPAWWTATCSPPSSSSVPGAAGSGGWRSPSSSRRGASHRSICFDACQTCSGRWRSWCGSSECGAGEPMPAPASISVDLDGLGHYAALYGLSPDVVEAAARRLVHRVAVPRFAELVESVGGRGTIFVIGGEV